MNSLLSLLVNQKKLSSSHSSGSSPRTLPITNTLNQDNPENMEIMSSKPKQLDDMSLITTCQTSEMTEFNGIPAIDLKQPEAKAQLVKACEEFGCFKVVNHGVPMEVMSMLEAQAISFFNMGQSEKNMAPVVGGPTGGSFGFGCGNIGPNGDVGWVEYLLFNSNPKIMKAQTSFLNDLPIPDSETFRMLLNEYVGAVREMGCQILNLIADGLKIRETNAWSKLLEDERSDSYFRLNYYPPCPHLQYLKGKNVIGFGEHTDPQLISIGRSNNISGLQICLKDGSWVSVTPDENSFFISVDDCLQVITNGRFQSVKHRVLVDGSKPRVSMIFFGGPANDEKIAPLASLIEEGEESLYNEYTWAEYKKSVYKSKLGDHRIGFFEKPIKKED